MTEPPDTLAVEVVEHPFTFRGGDNELARLLVETVNRMGGVGDDAEALYQRSLIGLRERGAEVVEMVRGAYADLPPEQYLDRWSLVELLTDLEEPAAVVTLREILATDIPPERFGDAHGFSTVAEEVMIRTTAVEALARLALRGEVDAVEALFDHLQHPQFSIRRAVVQALLDTEDERIIERLREQVENSGDEQLLSIRRTDVREVPQATGGLFLAGPASRDELPPHDLQGRQGS